MEGRKGRKGGSLCTPPSPLRVRAVVGVARLPRAMSPLVPPPPLPQPPPPPPSQEPAPRPPPPLEPRPRPLPSLELRPQPPLVSRPLSPIPLTAVAGQRQPTCLRRGPTGHPPRRGVPLRHRLPARPPPRALPPLSPHLTPVGVVETEVAARGEPAGGVGWPHPRRPAVVVGVAAIAGVVVAPPPLPLPTYASLGAYGCWAPWFLRPLTGMVVTAAVGAESRWRPTGLG